MGTFQPRLPLAAPLIPLLPLLLQSVSEQLFRFQFCFAAVAVAGGFLRRLFASVCPNLAQTEFGWLLLAELLSTGPAFLFRLCCFVAIACHFVHFSDAGHSMFLAPEAFLLRFLPRLSTVPVG